MKDINPQIQEALQTQVRFPTKERTLCPIKVKLLKTKDRISLKQAEEKKLSSEK